MTFSKGDGPAGGEVMEGVRTPRTRAAALTVDQVVIRMQTDACSPNGLRRQVK